MQGEREKIMAEAIETVHVIFGVSVAETLGRALPMMGATGRVISLPDMLSVGPIDPPEPALRRAWATSVLRLRDAPQAKPDGWPTEPERAWASATAPDAASVFWACLTSPPEHACFLAFASRMRDRAFDLVDATGLDFTTVGGIRTPHTLGMMRVQDFVSSGVYARRRAVPANERAAAADAWARLRRENAPFRIVRHGRLVSAPLTHYDDLIVGMAGPDWEVAARLVGRVLATWEASPQGEGTGDDALFGRILALGETGALELAGPGPGMRDIQVRRPA